MANVDNAFGLRPLRDANGAPYNGSGSLYHVAVGDAQVIAPGDPVIVTGTAEAGGVPTVTRATDGATERITGVMLGLSQGNSGLDGTGGFTHDSAQNTVTLTSQFILVEDNPKTVYEAQCSAGFAVTDVSANADLLAAASPSDGKSGWEVDSSTFAVGATLQVKVLRLVQREDNEVGANAVVEVFINLPTQANDIAGI